MKLSSGKRHGQIQFKEDVLLMWNCLLALYGRCCKENYRKFKQMNKMWVTVIQLQREILHFVRYFRGYLSCMNHDVSLQFTSENRDITRKQTNKQTYIHTYKQTETRA